MQQIVTYVSRHHSPPSANGTFCESLSTTVAKASPEHPVPRNDSINYIKKTMQQINLFTPALYVENWYVEFRPSKPQPYVELEFCDWNKRYFSQQTFERAE